MTADEYIGQVKGSIRIPAGSPERACKLCPAVIFWVGKIPVSVEPYKDGPRGVLPTAMDDGAGVAHMANCPGWKK